MQNDFNKVIANSQVNSYSLLIVFTGMDFSFDLFFFPWKSNKSNTHNL